MAWFLPLLLWLLGVGSGEVAPATQPGPPPAPVVLRSGDQTFHATTRLPKEGNVDFELDPGDRVDVTVHGSHAARRVVTFAPWACMGPSARIVLAPGQPAFRVPKLPDAPYELTVTSGHVRGVVMAAVFGPETANC